MRLSCGVFFRFFILCPLSAFAVSAIIAPRLQLFTNLVCNEIDSRQWERAGRDAVLVGMGTARLVPCAADPVVQANVTKLLTGVCSPRLLPPSPRASHLGPLLVTATVQGILSCLTAAFWGSVRLLPPPCLIG